MEESSCGDTQGKGPAVGLRPQREQRHSELGTSFVDHEAVSKEASMIPQLKRHEIQILLKAGHTQEDAARIAAVSLSTVQRVSGEPGVEVISVFIALCAAVILDSASLPCTSPAVSDPCTA